MPSEDPFLWTHWAFFVAMESDAFVGTAGHQPLIRMEAMASASDSVATVSEWMQLWGGQLNRM